MLEVLSFYAELLSSGSSQRVEPGAAVVFRRAPFGFHPALEQEPLQRRIKRAFADLQHFIGHVLEPLRHGVAMQRFAHERLQDQQLERAGQEVRNLSSHRLSMGISRSARSSVKRAAVSVPANI